MVLFGVLGRIFCLLYCSVGVSEFAVGKLANYLALLWANPIYGAALAFLDLLFSEQVVVVSY